MTDLPALLARAYELAATRRMVTTRRQNIDYRFDAIAAQLGDIIKDLEGLPEMEPDDDWQEIEDELDLILPYLESEK